MLCCLWDSKTPHRPANERVSYCVETSPPSGLSLQDGSPSLILLTLFLSFIFCPTSFQREWAAFLGTWSPPPVFRSCIVEIAQHSNDLLMNLWREKVVSPSYPSVILPVFPKTLSFLCFIPPPTCSLQHGVFSKFCWLSLKHLPSVSTFFFLIVPDLFLPKCFNGIYSKISS